MQYKYYVKSGELEVIVIASNWWDACRKALNSPHYHNGLNLDPTFFFIDQRGFRDNNTENRPAFAVRISEIAKECEGA